MSRALSPAVKTGLDAFRARLRSAFGARLQDVVLFGSHARGEANEESDVDVLVVIDDLVEDEKVRVFDLAYDVDREQPEWLGINPFVRSTRDVEELRACERLIIREIDRDGIRP